MIKTVATTPFQDQNSGTSGLRKKVVVFQQKNYVENFVQSIFDCLNDLRGQTLVLGGDGRFYNQHVLQIVIKMAAANGIGRIIIGRQGILSTPAVSHLIRKYQAQGGIILSASHNSAGPNGDFGIKFNIANGGPAPEKLTKLVFERSKQINRYHIVNVADINIAEVNEIELLGMRIQIIDPVKDYADLMEELFDFDIIRSAVKDGLRFRFDAMNAVTGPYGIEIFEKRLGFPKGSVVNSTPLPDFGGFHPDPNLVHARSLYEYLMAANAPDMGAASDGDGDRNLIIGRGQFVTPSDSLAIIAAQAEKIKGYKNGIFGIARSMPTSKAADQVAAKLKLKVYETPTGWKFFGNLLDANKVTFCGEESFGTGSNHIREKDGLWAILFWLNLLAVTGKSVKEITEDHWRQFGRNYYTRHDYEEVDAENAQALMQDLRARLDDLKGNTIAGLIIKNTDDFSYRDPIDNSFSLNQGIRIFFENDGRLVYRVSGTGTSGATVRVYIEKLEKDPEKLFGDTQLVLSQLIVAADHLVDLKHRLGRSAPSVIT